MNTFMTKCIIGVNYSNQSKCCIFCGQATFSSLGFEKFVSEDGKWLLHAKVWIRFSLRGITYIFSKEYEKEAWVCWGRLMLWHFLPKGIIHGLSKSWKDFHYFESMLIPSPQGKREWSSERMETFPPNTWNRDCGEKQRRCYNFY